MLGFKCFVPWDDEGLRLALGVCPTRLPVKPADAGWASHRGGPKVQRMDYSVQVRVGSACVCVCVCPTRLPVGGADAGWASHRGPKAQRMDYSVQVRV